MTHIESAKTASSTQAVDEDQTDSAISDEHPDCWHGPRAAEPALSTGWCDGACDGGGGCW